MTLEYLDKITIREPDETYDANRANYVTSHSLATYRKSPLLFKQQREGLASGGDNEAFAFGRAFHVLALEGRDAYEARFARGGPINPTTDKPYGSDTKKFREWVATIGKPAITQDEAIEIELMADAIRGHPEASKLLANGLSERVIRQELCGVPCQSRIDWLTEGAIVDVKSTRDLDEFESQIVEYGYVEQLAFYWLMVRERMLADGLEQIAKLKIPLGCYAAPLAPFIECYLIAAEKGEPRRVAVYQVDPFEIERAARGVQKQLKALANSFKDNRWPTGTEELRQWPRPTFNTENRRNVNN